MRPHLLSVFQTANDNDCGNYRYVSVVQRSIMGTRPNYSHATTSTFCIPLTTLDCGIYRYVNVVQRSIMGIRPNYSHATTSTFCNPLTTQALPPTPPNEPPGDSRAGTQPLASRGGRADRQCRVKPKEGNRNRGIHAPARNLLRAEEDVLIV